MLNGERKIARPLRWAMVGGGRLSQVGYKHRLGALRDNTAYQLVAGAFDLDFERGKDFGRNLGVAEDRLYPDYQTLIAEEAKRDDGVEVVTIATPNFTHHEITKACLEAGLHVICEKPLFFTVAECEEIAALATAKGLIVGVTYGFTGHPLVHQMAAMVKKGMLGDIRIVDLQYTHGFSSGDDANASDAQRWRTNPKTSGPTFVLGDIGTHLYYLSEIVLPHMKMSAGSGCPPSTPARWRASATASWAPRPRSNGPTRSRTSSSTRFRASHRGSCTTACPISRKRACATSAWARFTPRASATAGPTSISGSPRRSTRGTAATRPS
jgi:predicted dehydrogenase